MEDFSRNDSLREKLEMLYERFAVVEFIDDDPISIPHRYSKKEDIEVAGFLSSTIAWGNRKAILQGAGKMMQLMDDAPYEFVMSASEKELDSLRNFVYRTFNGEDFRDFVLALRGISQKWGSVGNLIETLFLKHGAIAPVLAEFREHFFSFNHGFHCEKHLSSVVKGAACKRLNMYLRWMVREDPRGIDFGLWKSIPKSELFLPLDVHTSRVGRKFSLLERKQTDWKATVEITDSLRAFDRDDPVRFDFALFGAGVNHEQ